MALALVGGAFLSASLQVFLEKITSREFRDFLTNKKLNISLLDEFKRTLLTLQAVLIDAEEKQITNPAIKDWLDLMKDAVLDAEDLLDQINTQALGFKVEAEYPYHTIGSQVRNFLSSPFQFHQKMNSNLETLCRRLHSIEAQISTLGLQVATSKTFHRAPTSSLVDESNMVGRHDDKEKLMDLLLSDNANNSGLGVISICGMGGVGKTTLAQLLYNDPRVEYFDLKVWAWVAEFNVTRVTKTLIESATSKLYESDNLNVLQIELRQIMKDKKFLIVLDDLWNDNYNEWVKLLTPFNFGKSGSRIIITTRQKDVAQMGQTLPVHYLEPLSDEDCWSLLAKHAFVHDNPSRHPLLEVVGKNIAESCGGLPIAAKTLGGLLRLETDIKEWIKVLKSNIWDIPRNDVLPALWLSYLHLGSNLKRCFAYCSIFPKGYRFNKQFTVLLWMAEGFIQESHNEKSMEEIGCEYFDELLSRSLIQHYKGDDFIMHDLINDLAVVVSGKTCCSSLESCTTPNYVRHLSYSGLHYESFNRFGRCSSMKCLRTFLPLPSNHYYYDGYKDVADYDYLSRHVTHDLVPKLRCLRVLSLRHYNIKELPDSIGNLKHLRLLDLCYTPIRRLPNAVCKLYNLQSLLLYGCFDIVELPSDISKLVNLRHLEFWSSHVDRIPRQLAGLEHLNTLGCFYVGKTNAGLSLRDLGKFPKLRGRLVIDQLENVSDASDAFQANLINKEQIEVLHLLWSKFEARNCQISNELLEQLQPSTNLRVLFIGLTGGLSRFPSWLGHPSYTKLETLGISIVILARHSQLLVSYLLSRNL